MRHLALCLVVAATACDKPSDTTAETPARAGAAGDPCAKDGDAVCKDEQIISSCHGGIWSETPCRGPEGCKRMGIMVKCDESVGMEGEKCTRNGGYACNGDASSQLLCENHKWRVVKVCRGPQRCTTQIPFVKCDTSVGRRGDVCEKEGTATCDADGKTIIECHDGHYATKRICPKKCVNKDKRVRCE